LVLPRSTSNGTLQPAALLLARQLIRVRRNLELEAPHGPAWTATSEWVDDLERQIRDLGVEVELAIALALTERSRRQPVA
jgi:hypothetical protein